MPTCSPAAKGRRQALWHWAVAIALSALAVLTLVARYPDLLPAHTTALMGLLRGTGYFSRRFRPDGLPISNIPRLGLSVENPFYVVHYGILYSGCRAAAHPGDPLWAGDDTLGLWNLPPPRGLVTFEHALVASAWVVAHCQDRGRGYHLYYDFPWPYPGTSQGYLAPPWYSGLTDGYALVLLLRAHAETGGAVYLETARRLYQSVRRPVAAGGSLVWLEGGHPWIEEYVAPNNDRPPLVFNGMFYATLGVLAYERAVRQTDPLGPKLLATLRVCADRYERDGWTHYDRFGRPNSFKYHGIHVGIARQLYRMTGDPRFQADAERWAGFRENYFHLAFVRGRPTPNSWLVLGQCLAATALGALGCRRLLGSLTRSRT